MLSFFYANECFCFDEETKKFYSHLELAYWYQKDSQFNPKLILTDDFYKSISSNLPKVLDNNMNQEQGKVQVEEEIKMEATEVKLMELAEDEKKNSFELFTGVLDLQNYKNKLDLSDFVVWLLAKNLEMRRKFAVYAKMRDQGLRVESGSSYGFEFLLYPSQADGLITHSHSQYAVCISEEGLNELKFVDIHRKHKIANNYKKVILKHGKYDC